MTHYHPGSYREYTFEYELEEHVLLINATMHGDGIDDWPEINLVSVILPEDGSRAERVRAIDTTRSKLVEAHEDAIHEKARDTWAEIIDDARAEHRAGMAEDDRLGLYDEGEW